MEKMKKYIIVSFAIAFVFFGCTKDFLDVNEDPNQPTVAQIDQLLPGIEYDISDDFSMDYSKLGWLCAIYTHQISTRESVDQYGVSGNDYAIGTFWQDLYYGVIPDIDLLIALGTEQDALQYRGIAKILKAYVFSQMVDLWGDIPFSEANQKDNFNPNFDDDAAIYPQLFAMLDDGIADILNEEAANIKTPGADDLVFGGNLDKWVRAANTIKLKLYNQVRATSLWNATDVAALLAGDLMEADGNLMVKFGTSNNPENRHPAFAGEWNGSQISNYISPWFFEILKGINPNIFTNIEDPRIPYYFYNQLAGGEDSENPVEYRDGDFVSIYFGSVGVNKDHAGRSTFTVMGMYACGGKFDDGTGGQANANSGAGDAPVRWLTYADALYIQAELAHDGVGGDARALLEEAMVASFAQVDDVCDMVTKVGGQVVPVLSGSTEVDDYIAAVLAKYDAASANKQLEIIMTQKWIANYGGSHVDQYSDYRRTGYPVLFDANTDPSNGGTDGNGLVPTQCTRSYPLSFPYDQDELDLNTNAPGQKVIATDGIFWDL